MMPADPKSKNSVAGTPATLTTFTLHCLAGQTNEEYLR